MQEYSLNLLLFLPSEKMAEIIFKAISPELESKFERRSKTLVDINKNVLSLAINAKDRNALKASFNNYMKLIILSYELITN